jgi:pyruvate,water dikinase
VSGVIPAAWISEAWFTFIYKLVKQRDGPSALTFLMGFDSLPIRADKSLYDIAQWVRKREDLSVYLKGTPTSEIVTHLSEQTLLNVNETDWREWQYRFLAHLQEFGHTIYNLDFANPVPADDPAPMLDTLKMYVAGQGVNPYVRQKASADRREKATQAMQKKLKGMRLNLFQKNLERAQRYAPLREDGLADVGLSYPLVRQMIFELGRRFTDAGMIAQPEDIFWLEQDEVEQAAANLDRGEQVYSLAEIIPQRKAILKSAKRAAPPMALPQIKVFGVDLMKMKSGKAQRGSEETLKGVAASPGSVTAPANVLHGPEDFSKMRTGDVLVASITTPAWTPLFARAAAVVTDIGGPLSHGSIVAREYGIPAVLGTDSATKYIQDGQTVTVDGDSGLVTLLQDV